MIKKLLILFLIGCFCFGFLAFAQSVTSGDLIEHAAQYDLKEVVYQAEAIGEALERGDFCWVNARDKDAAIGLWLIKEDCDKIKFFGDYNTTGDIIEAKGVFHRACVEHSGELDIHVAELNIIQPGAERKHQFSRKKMNAFLILFSVLCLLWILQILKIVQRKKSFRS
ncbi:MAG: DNA-binding protein [Candidatus Gygaella obscura]|nr:DNA-binding protein [Candidatus Gygaella obscura]